MPENQKTAIVGELATTDDDPTQTFTYALTDNAQGRFKVVGRILQTAVALNFEQQSQYTIRIKTTDSGSPAKSFEMDMTVYVTDVNEIPTAVKLGNDQVRNI